MFLIKEFVKGFKSTISFFIFYKSYFLQLIINNYYPIIYYADFLKQKQMHNNLLSILSQIFRCQNYHLRMNLNLDRIKDTIIREKYLDNNFDMKKIKIMYSKLRISSFEI